MQFSEPQRGEVLLQGPLKSVKRYVGQSGMNIQYLGGSMAFAHFGGSLPTSDQARRYLLSAHRAALGPANTR